MKVAIRTNDGGKYTLEIGPDGFIIDGVHKGDCLIIGQGQPLSLLRAADGGPRPAYVLGTAPSLKCSFIASPVTEIIPVS